MRVSSSEIVSFRDANKDKTTVDLPKFEDPAFRALVEENVKVSVSNIVTSAVMKHHWTAYLAQEHKTRRANPDAPLKPVYVHGEFELSFIPRVPQPLSRSIVPGRN